MRYILDEDGNPIKSPSEEFFSDWASSNSFVAMEDKVEGYTVATLLAGGVESNQPTWVTFVTTPYEMLGVIMKKYEGHHTCEGSRHQADEQHSRVVMEVGDIPMGHLDHIPGVAL